MPMPWEPVVDRGLIELAQRGDRDAYARVATEASHRLYAVALRVLRDPEAASDALQSALVRMWVDLPTLREAERFEAWSDRVLVNTCRETLRRGRPVLSMEVAGIDLPANDAAGQVEARDELDRAFATLPAEQRAVLVLHYYRDLSVHEIAEALALAEGTVKWRLHAARQAMRAAIEAGSRVHQLEERPA